MQKAPEFGEKKKKTERVEREGRKKEKTKNEDSKKRQTEEEIKKILTNKRRREGR
jgi:hypothetical protein